jgi:hypothetical protein
MPDETTQNTDVETADGETTPRVYANVATPRNAAVAANVLLDNSTGYADAEQAADIDHGT